MSIIDDINSAVNSVNSSNHNFETASQAIYKPTDNDVYPLFQHLPTLVGRAMMSLQNILTSNYLGLLSTLLSACATEYFPYYDLGL
jgi:hypothetical protein